MDAASPSHTQKSFLETVAADPEQDALRRSNEALVLATLTAQSLQLIAVDALRRQTEAIALAAHELRNPLVPIRTVSMLLGKINSLDELPRLAGVIERQVAHMSRLIDDLLDMSRIATGKLHLHHVPVELLKVFDHVLDVCRPAMDARRQHFVADISNRPFVIQGDAVRLTQIFTNLLQNASKYTPEEGAISMSCVMRRTVEGLGEAIVTISDNGIGIMATALPKIFEPFVQDPHAIDFSKDGLGIGLTLVRELVQSHGGTVTATSAGAGRGSEFVVVLPLA